VVALDEGEESRGEELVRNSLCAVLCPDARALFEVALWELIPGCFFRLATFFCDAGLCQLSIEVSNIDLLGLLLFLLHSTQVEFTVSGGSGFVAFLGIAIFLWLLCFLLLRETLEEFGDFVNVLVCQVLVHMIAQCRTRIESKRTGSVAFGRVLLDVRRLCDLPVGIHDCGSFAESYRLAWFALHFFLRKEKPGQ
jgi:hypothetical protein